MYSTCPSVLFYLSKEPVLQLLLLSLEMRMLFTFMLTGSIAIGFADFGRGQGLVYFSNVDCNGDEDNLYSCNRQDISEHFCTHAQDAGVICIGESITSSTSDFCIVFPCDK